MKLAKQLAAAAALGALLAALPAFASAASGGQQSPFIQAIKQLNKLYADLAAATGLLGDATVGGYGTSGGILAGMGQNKSIAKLGKEIGIGSDPFATAAIGSRVPALFPT